MALLMTLGFYITLNKDMPAQKLKKEERVPLKGNADPNATKIRQNRFKVMGVISDESKGALSYLVVNDEKKMVAVAAGDCNVLI